MREARKRELLHSFPSLPPELEKSMHGKGAANYVVLLTNGNELFARCYHRYVKGTIIERQRYVFAKDGAVRYGKDDGEQWAIRKEFREPVFCSKNYGYSFDNSYSVLNWEAVESSCMKYSMVKSRCSLPMEYLRLYCRHPNLEYLVKSGYDCLLTEDYAGYWGACRVLRVSADIDWSSNNLLKMLRLNRTEFAALKGAEHCYQAYIYWRERYPKYKPDELLYIAKIFGYEVGTLERFCEATGLKPRRLTRYLGENNIRSRDYSDYLDQCIKLKYDLNDTAISMPHDFIAIHTRLSNIIKYKNAEGLAHIFRENMEQRKVLEYAGNGLVIRQPGSYEEIVAEGKLLHHCVGGYAERHALGKLHIMFIRRTDEPDDPYYTMEISTDGRIIQVRGVQNAAPVSEVSELVEQYKSYLASLFKKARKSA